MTQKKQTAKQEKNQIGLESRIFEAISGTSARRYLCVGNLETHVTRWSKGAVAYFGLPGEYTDQGEKIWAERIHPDEQVAYRQNIAAIHTGVGELHDMEYRVRNKKGDYVVCTCQGVRSEGEPPLFVGTIVNHGIADDVDPTTNLHNIHAFRREAARLTDQSGRSLVMTVGVNSFRAVNDVYGYTIGNQVLRQVADALVEAARGRGKVYRMDGAKFALCLGKMGEEEARAFYAGLQRRVRTCAVIQDRSLLLSISGGAMFVDETVSGEDTVRACISYAKRKSQTEHYGELVFFHDLEQDNLRTQAMLQAIRQDVLEGCHGFYLHYQPLVDPATGRLAGMEALLRWSKEPYGDLPPGKFIQWLEEDDCFFELGHWIFRQALTDGKKMVEEYPDFMVNVNVTYSQLERDDFRDMLGDTLAETGFPPENLYIELTERSQARDMASLRRDLDFLCAQGIRIALDDFGTGTASLNLLRELPISCLKIDRTYLMNIQTNRADEIIVSAVIDAARSLGIHVCLEGVENQEIKDFVSRYQVSTHQGFYYARPMPIQCLRQMAAAREEGATAG